MSDKDAEKLFVDLFSNDVNVIYNDVKKIELPTTKKWWCFL